MLRSVVKLAELASALQHPFMSDAFIFRPVLVNKRLRPFGKSSTPEKEKKKGARRKLLGIRGVANALRKGQT